MRITALKQQQKNAERVSVFVDGKYSFSLSLDELLEQKIKNGDELTEPRLAGLKKLSSDGKLRTRALEWTLNRPRSIREFRDYMRRKQTEPEMVEKLIAEFAPRGYLDEARFAEWLVEVRASAGKSNRAIAAELASKGIERELANQALAQAGYDEQQRLNQVLARKAGLSRYRADRQKLISYLVRQGFSYDLIKSTLELDPET